MHTFIIVVALLLSAAFIATIGNLFGYNSGFHDGFQLAKSIFDKDQP